MSNGALAGGQIQKVIVYIKDDCHLCDTMLEQLEDNRLTGRLETPFYLEIRDIEDHPGWYESYREYVPVVVVNGEEVCHYFFDQQEFESALSCP